MTDYVEHARRQLEEARIARVQTWRAFQQAEEKHRKTCEWYMSAKFLLDSAMRRANRECAMSVTLCPWLTLTVSVDEASHLASFTSEGRNGWNSGTLFGDEVA